MNHVARAGVACWRFNERIFNAIKSAFPRDPWVGFGAGAATWTVVFIAMGYQTAGTVAAGICLALPLLRLAVER